MLFLSTARRPPAPRGDTRPFLHSRHDHVPGDDNKRSSSRLGRLAAPGALSQATMPATASPPSLHPYPYTSLACEGPAARRRGVRALQEMPFRIPPLLLDVRVRGMPREPCSQRPSSTDVPATSPLSVEARFRLALAGAVTFVRPPSRGENACWIPSDFPDTSMSHHICSQSAATVVCLDILPPNCLLCIHSLSFRTI